DSKEDEGPERLESVNRVAHRVIERLSAKKHIQRGPKVSEQKMLAPSIHGSGNTRWRAMCPFLDSLEKRPDGPGVLKGTDSQKALPVVSGSTPVSFRSC